ncbi:bifunctional oligoribonuclease/PAP phosphatase NrnA [Hathewaya histolytica]|uniref:DHH family protein n=2 Tax=Hathewaya histolytica TaxID=1498 RepID=A0A4U9REA6_HATHI|nr:bifunctional oligoribonuclease/PAP phosphatase NrnA [Hathewaya histolytica]VTQ89526.1 DHH family protein [Hathewaya histolytica]
MISKVVDYIKNPNKIGITFHTSPDGDSLGSSLALLQILRKLNKESYIICKERIPDNFRFLPYSEEITGKVTVPLKGTECIIVLDCGNIERINADLDFYSPEYSILNIDHHKSNENYGKLNYINTEASAVAEIIYTLMKNSGVELDKNIATCLYTSILTDTGSFRHSSTTSTTHNIVADLIRTGIDFSNIHRIIFDNKSFNRIKLYGKVIDDMELSPNGKVAFIYVKKDYFDQLDLEEGDTSDLLTFGMKIDTVEVVVLLKEKEDGTKVSLRSKNIIDVRLIAESYNGGGHTRAAGFISNSPALEVKTELLYKIGRYYNE